MNSGFTTVVVQTFRLGCGMINILKELVVLYRFAVNKTLLHIDIFNLPSYLNPIAHTTYRTVDVLSDHEALPLVLFWLTITTTKLHFVNASIISN